MEMNPGNIDMSKLTTAQCPATGCDETAFYQLFEIKKLSSLVSPTGKEMIMQVPVFKCSACGETWRPEGQGE